MGVDLELIGVGWTSCRYGTSPTLECRACASRRPIIHILGSPTTTYPPHPIPLTTPTPPPPVGGASHLDNGVVYMFVHTMWKRLRDMFGSGTGLRGELEALRLRVEQVEAWPDLGQRVETCLVTLAKHRENSDGLTARVDHLERDVDALHDERKDLVIAIAEGIERTDRAERRIKNTIRRARKELEGRGYADPGLEAEAFEFREVNGDGGDESGLQPLPAPVETVPEESSIPGVPLETLRHARGL